MQRTELEDWKALDKHSQSIRFNRIEELKLFRPDSFVVSEAGLTLDFSHQRMNKTTLDLLVKLAETCQLRAHIEALFQGKNVNHSESSPALHTALREFELPNLFIANQNVYSNIHAAREQIRGVSEKLRAGRWLGFSGKPITDVVNIGIGGSDFGPRFCLHALKEYSHPSLNFYFISDADPVAFKYTLLHLKPETTLFIVSSKSFTTQETLCNARKAMLWFGRPDAVDQHFIAVTAHPERAQAYGLRQIIPIWGWIGGRYSACSAINLITAIAIGYDHFIEFLQGAHKMDEHFRYSEFHTNLPVLMALIGIWNNNFLHIHHLLLLIYSQQLKELLPYVQQLDMESNGKSIDKQGRSVNYATGPIVWGGLGNQAQHSYYQLLCQGTHQITADFISMQCFDKDLINYSCTFKRWALVHGIDDNTNPQGYLPGNTPLNHLMISDCTPKTVGSLVSLYEHKAVTQAALWNINPFDQPGVESSKRCVSLFNEVLATTD